MRSLITKFQQLRCSAVPAAASSLLPKTAANGGLRYGARALSTESTPSSPLDAELQSIKMPFQGVQHARRVPATPSYFSREPFFNDLLVRLTNLLAKYNHLPTVEPKDAISRPWTKLADIRAQFGEQIKAAHYSTALRVARRLNKIEASVRPAEIDVVLSEMLRSLDTKQSRPNALTLDRHGRAVGVGKRKESTARAFVVEGTGEVLINGKTLSQAFGRVHDRESAVWALVSTQRLDKYNVWALVEGGGSTGQAEATTLAIAKALVAHEPALKTTLRKAGCITRDARTVERKKHGHLKARKSPAWVKR